MQTRLPESLLTTPAGREAEAILRRCVHCGFCNATCPTFRITGNELEGPRGRIYLLKGLLEGEGATRRTVAHLDRCLGCRACETTCPSGVNFHRLADIGREMTGVSQPRPWWDRWRRRLAARLFDGSLLFRFMVAAARTVRPLLPGSLRRQLPTGDSAAWPPPSSDEGRRVLILAGCVQPALGPNINGAAARILHRRGVDCRPAQGCCGALAYHLDDLPLARRQIRRNIDAWLPAAQAGDGLVVNASGCAAFIQDYGKLCQDDPRYAQRGTELADALVDICDFLEPAETLDGAPGPEVVLHIPCTLKNGLRGGERLRRLLRDSGWRLAETGDDGQCCGSAGAYSLLHPRTSKRLLEEKLARLQPSGAADVIVTANLGCGLHLASGSALPVRHWLEVWDELEA